MARVLHNYRPESGILNIINNLPFLQIDAIINPFVQIRKANRLLLGVIMERMGVHTVQRCAADKPEWVRVVK